MLKWGYASICGETGWMEGKQTGYSDYPLTCRTDSKLPFEVRVHVCLTEHYGHRTAQHRGNATMTLPMGKPVTEMKEERARDLSIRPTSWCCILLESNPNAWPWNKEETVLQFNYVGQGYSCLQGCSYFFIGTLITSQPKVAWKIPGSNSTWSSFLMQ